MDKYILIIGRYNSGESLDGKDKFLKRLYENINPEFEKIVFVDFFMGYKLSNLKNKLFGKKITASKGNVYVEKFGIFQIILFVLRNKISSALVAGVEGYVLLWLLLLKIKKGISIFYIMHGIYRYEIINDKNGKVPLFFKWKMLFTEYVIVKSAHKIFYLSNNELEMMNKYFNLKDKELLLTNHGVDESFFIKREEVNLFKPLRFVYSGGFGRQLKGFDFLIDSLLQLNICFELAICGKVEDEKVFEEKIRFLSDEIKVSYKGMLSSYELAELYKKCDIFILPSKNETFSIATLEAMASGLIPVLTSDTGAIRFVENGKSGFIINYGNSEELIKTIMILNNNRNIFKEISLNAQKAVEKITWNEVGRYYYNFIR